jgi:hypothetical protein
MRRSTRAIAATLFATSVTFPLVAAQGEHGVDQRVEQCLERLGEATRYRAYRRLEAETRGGSMRGWLEAWTELNPNTGFTYAIVSEGGSDDIRNKVLRKALEREKELVAEGDQSLSSLAPSNYTFDVSGVDDGGLLKVLLSARRKAPLLVDGAMFLEPADGDLVRVEGKLVKNPSFWIKKVDLVRTFDRVNGRVLPVALDSVADVRLFGRSTFRMTYNYVAVDGRAVTPASGQ